MLIGDKGTTTLLYRRSDFSDLDDEGGMGVELWRCDLGQRTKYILSQSYAVVATETHDPHAEMREHEVYTTLGLGNCRDDARMIHEAVEAYETTWQMWHSRHCYHLKLRSERYAKEKEATGCDSEAE